MSYRSLKVNTASTTTIISTADAKTHLKVDVSDDDTLIDNLVAAATQSCEIFTNRYFTDTVVTQYSDKFPEIKLLYKSPVSSITHIKYYNSSDVLTTWDAANYILDDSSEPARVGLAVDASYPDIADRINAVEVKYTVGYGSSASDVPQAIQQAILLTVGNWYQNRQEVVTGTIATQLPKSAQYLLEQYKVQIC
tara:strand:+ start:523 stop:1104 length:582 start_codon:yes stop_codon:yes gene_type:complete